MKIDLNEANPTLISLIENPEQIITLDANFLIPPNRTSIYPKGFDFLLYKNIWLDPIFQAFPSLALHEAVYRELIMTSVYLYIDQMLSVKPPRIIIYADSDLNAAEKILRDTIENRIYPYTNYDPRLDNKDDRGEVKSLSYIAAKGLIYFAAHDHNALQLIEKVEQWSTGLDNIRAVKMYELIFYLYRKNAANRKNLRMLYKYQYNLTNHEKKTNPEWGALIDRMNDIYHE